MFAFLAKKLCNVMITKGVIAREDRELYDYAFDLLLSKGVVILLCLTIGLCVRSFWLTCLFFMFFFPLRSYAGGYHTRHEWTCFMWSITIFAALLAYANFVRPAWYVHFAILLAAGIPIWLLSPVEDENKPLDAGERQAYRKKAHVILAAELAAAMVLVLLQAYRPTVTPAAAMAAGCLGMQALLLLAGYTRNRFFPLPPTGE